jgi:hypothetical protein
VHTFHVEGWELMQYEDDNELIESLECIQRLRDTKAQTVLIPFEKDEKRVFNRT